MLNPSENKQTSADILIPGEAIENGRQQESEAENKYSLIWLNPSNCCYAVYAKLKPDQVLLQQSPLALMKALKVSLISHLADIMQHSFVFVFFKCNLFNSMSSGAQ
jgi:hypothetical protein